MTQKPFTTLDDFELGKYLGSGQFGQVWLVRHKKTEIIVALKLLDKDKILQNNCLKQLRREIEIHSKLKHRNILRLYGFFYDKLRIYLVLEYVQNELFDLLQKHGKFSEKTSAQYILQVCCALRYIHLNRIIHRDLKPENILISDGVLKIADFGAAVRNKDNKRYTMCGTKEYLAPEMWEKRRHSVFVDIWCVGVLTYELLTGSTPFGSNARDSEYIEKVGAVNYSFPLYVSDLAQDFVKCFLKKVPESRMHLDEVPSHPWIVLHVSEEERKAYYTN